MTRKVNPTKLLCQDVIETETTKGGIILPTAVVKQDSMKAKVLVAGKGTPEIEMIYKEGDTVLIHPRAGSKFHFEDKEYRLIDMSDVFFADCLL